ncbi:MAG: helix-turn-helix domain-containing protein, partial [Bacillota bacterium]
LEQMVARGEFRGDLFYRLNVLPLHIPPLRERGGDILLLAEQFCARFSQALGKSLNGFTRAEQVLLRYHWPGNVRELENAVAYAAHMETGPRVQLRTLPDRIKNREQSDSQQPGLVPLADMERDLIMRALQYYGHSAAGKAEAARHLGIGVATLYRKLKRYRLG